MKRLNLSGPQDFMALLVRRKWWIVIPFAATACAVAVLSQILPKLYVSRAQILIKPRDIPTDFVRDLVAGTTDQRISAIQARVFKRDNLLAIAAKYEDQMPDFKKLNHDDQVTKIGKSIDMAFSASDRVGGGQLPVTAFTITYSNRNPEVAQKILSDLTGLFIKQDLADRETQVNGTVEFLTSELEKLSLRLNESDTKYKALKKRRQNELPTQQDANFRNLDRLQQSQQQISNELIHYEEALRILNSQLSDTPEKLPKSGLPGAVADRPQPLNPKIQEYWGTEAELSAYLGKGDGEGNPDVVNARKHLARLRSEFSDEDAAIADRKKEDKKPEATPETEMVKNRAYSSIAYQIEQINIEIDLDQKAREANEKNIAIYLKRTENAPQAEQEMADILRENLDLNKQYQEMNDKLTSARLSESLETQAKGSQLEILESANLPATPSKPQKSTLIAYGMMLSLFVGLVIGVGVDVANQKMWTQSDVEAMLGATVLVEIPQIVVPSDLIAAKRKQLLSVLSLVAITAAYGVFLYFVYLHQSYVLSQLDPLLQKLY